MRRGTKSRSALLGALTLAAIVVTAPAALADGPPAVEEYVFTLPGAKTSGAGEPEPLSGQAQRTEPAGVTGERRQEPTTLAAIGSSAASPAGVVILVALGACAALAMRPRADRG